MRQIDFLSSDARKRGSNGAYGGHSSGDLFVIEPLGIVITKYQEGSTVHVNVSRDLRQQADPPVFDTVIRQANQIAAAAEMQPGRRTLKQKYGYGDLATRYVDLAQELLTKLEI